MPASGHAPVTLADVATEAGVHPATVSRAISRPELVQDATRRRVEEAVEHLGYVPNRAARQLASGRTSTIGVLVPDITNPFFSGMVQAAQHRAAEEHLLVLLADTAQRARTEVALVRSLAPNVDGFVLCSPVAPTRTLRASTAGRSFVFVNRRARDVDAVVLDQQHIARLALTHLQALGHGRIGVLEGPAGYWSSTQRARVFDLEGVTRLGTLAPTFEGGASALDAVLAGDITGVVAFNDVMALGLMAAAVARGIRIPDDLSVIGSDDVPMAAMANPPLSTVGAPLDELGRAAVDTLTARLAGETPRPALVQPHLIARASTAAPASVTR